ncbi:hypothetical protein JTB14_001952 [Gonioctena quinquepunctata]|nr:hypothetical protein JTB14_001952 [Gonioctena quinquepunctata]
MAKKGFPCKKEDILQSVQKFLLDVPWDKPFKHNRPGDGWFEVNMANLQRFVNIVPTLQAFLKRHPQIGQIPSEGVTSASSCVSEADIRKWFAEIQEYLIEKDLLHVISDPSRVFNGDEIGFHICPSTEKVFAKRGSENVYSVDTAPSKECITVMFTFSANSAICCPMLCGLCPFSADAVDYSKCLGAGSKESDTSGGETNHVLMDNRFFKSIVGKETIEKFEKMETILDQDDNEHFYKLYKLWQHFKAPRKLNSYEKMNIMKMLPQKNIMNQHKKICNHLMLTKIRKLQLLGL